MWWQLLLVYIYLFLVGRLCHQCVPRKLRSFLFLPNLFTNDTFSSSELCPSNNSSACDPEILQPNKYNVFISFRGNDIRNTFLSHLYFYLNDFKKISTYKDDVNLKRGQEISPSLLQAIESSDVYIVIFSPNYADSPWCLEELEKILQCKKLYGRRVIPVFYGVDPSEVENQKLPSTAGNIQSWRAALMEIANISGFDSQVIRRESELIEEIGKAVFQAIHGGSQMVKLSSYSASRGLVGVERKIEQMEAFLCFEESGNRTIGLWGMAGIGKTVLAKALFDLFSSQFEASYFINFADITSGQLLQSCGDLQNDMFSKLLGDKSGRAGGTLSYDLTLLRLGRTKALIVIDDVGNDVGNIGPLKDLFNGKYSDMFGPGSIIVMTSRNKQLLKSVCHHVYEVEALDYGEALKLFCLHAFKGDIVQTGYVEMVQRAIHYAAGNPLAIAVLGAHLYGRDLKFWGLELEALLDNPNPVVENIFRRSYDGLTQAEKDVFLDLACFYHYWRSKELQRIEEMLLEGGRGNLITNLIDKSLLMFGTCISSEIEMNALLQDLGRRIVNEQRQVGKCSRLWKAKDVYYFFKESKGTEFTVGILWDVGDKEYKVSDLHMQPDAFVKMENLQFLVILPGTCNLVLPEDGLKCLPNALRILEWYSFTSKCLPSQFSAQNLVTLHLINSKVEQLWVDELNVDLGNLKFLRLNGSKYLRKFPDLSTAKIVKEIDLSGCESLVELPSSILHLPKLECLDVSCCSSLNWNSLECYANRRQEWNCYSDILPNLNKLNLSCTPIPKVPDFITRLHILALDCSNCRKLREIPVIPSLERLSLSGSLIERVIELEKLTKLVCLNFSTNKQLIHLPNDFHKLKSLKELSLAGCSNLSSLPDTISDLIHLERLDLSYTAVEELSSSIGSDLTRLSRLYLDYCRSLASLPDAIHKLSNLKALRLNSCSQLSHLPKLPSSLKTLEAHGCKSLQTLLIDIEKHELCEIEWNFSKCRKLDREVCSMLVEKFAQDLVRSTGFSRILLPAKWGSNGGGKGGRIMGSNDYYNNRMVTVKLRGQPWKLKSLIFCALLNSPPHLNTVNKYFVECVLLNNDNVRATDVVSSCYWPHVSENEDEVQECQYSSDLLMWSTKNFYGKRAIQLVAEKNPDGDATVEFLFRSGYTTKRGSKRRETSDLIKKCRVIPVYDNREVTYDKEEDDGDDGDDGDQSPESLERLYDQLCAPASESLFCRNRLRSEVLRRRSICSSFGR